MPGILKYHRSNHSYKAQTITPSYNNMMKAIHEALKTNDVLKSNYYFFIRN